MNRLIVIFLFILLTKNLFSQVDQRTIHQVQNEQYSSYKFNSEESYNIFNSPPNIRNLSSMTLSKQVFGWNPYWVGTAYTSYNYSLLSTVVYFSYEVDTATGSYTDIHFWRTTNLIPLAHSSNVKVVLTVTNFGVTQNTKILNSSLKRQRLIDSIKSLVLFRGADGVNIDFESVGSSQRANLVTFMTALSQQMHTAIPNSKVSIDLPAVDWNNSFDIAALNNVCDQMLIMGYDYYWSGAPNAGPTAPLVSGGIWGSYNVTNSVNYYLSGGATSAKLLLAVPYYGYEWPTTNGNLNSTTTGAGTAYAYSSIKPRSITYGRLWDANSLTPWYKYQSSGWNQGWYDDSVSLGLKYDLVNAVNMGGIGIWALSYDGSNNELWNEISAKFGLTGISLINDHIPERYSLLQNYPNPFNPDTKINFDIPGSSVAQTFLSVYDILGKEVKVLVNQKLQPGSYKVDWNASNYPSGIYFYKLVMTDNTNHVGFTETRKMILIK